MAGDPADSIARPRPGTLFVVATPIGNLADLRRAARDVLRDADLLLAEDTRHTAQLLHRLRHRAGPRRARVAARAQRARRGCRASSSGCGRGASVALVSDAGHAAGQRSGRGAGAGRRRGRRSRSLPCPARARRSRRCRSRRCRRHASRSRDSCRRSRGAPAQRCRSWPARRARWCSTRRRIALRESLDDLAAVARRGAPGRGRARAHQEVRDRLPRHARRRWRGRRRRIPDMARGEIVLVVQGAAQAIDGGRRRCGPRAARPARRAARVAGREARRAAHRAAAQGTLRSRAAAADRAGIIGAGVGQATAAPLAEESPGSTGQGAR